MQRHLAVGQVDGFAAEPRLALELTAEWHERGDVGDGVEDAEATVATMQAQRLVEVARGGWVDGHERDVGAVDDGQRRGLSGQTGDDLCGGLVRFALRREREPCRQFQLAAQAREVDAGRLDQSSDHALFLPASGPSVPTSGRWFGGGVTASMVSLCCASCSPG